MAKAMNWFEEKAKAMVEEDRVRDQVFKAYEKIYHCEWELPEKVKELGWVRRLVSSDGHDAVEAGTRMLSSLMPRVKMQPLRGDPETKRLANQVERNLKWQLISSNRRRTNKIEADVVKSALLYMAIAVNVIDLDHHMKLVESNGGDLKALKRWRRTGRFVVNVYNPQDVHVLQNSFGVQAVLLCQVRPASEVMNEWGSRNKKLKELAEEGKKVKYWDWMDDTDRCVWVTDETGSGVVAEIIRDEHGLELFPWVALMGGSRIEKRKEDQYHPMLYSAHFTGQWVTQNIGLSLSFSEVIAKAAAPDIAEEGSNYQDSTVIDYGDPSRLAKVPPGNTLRQIPKNQIDRSMLEVVDRLGGMIGKSTVSQILQGGQLPAGTAFSTLNLATQTALSALKPAQELAQNALAEILTLMILWVNQTGEALTGYGYSRTDKGVEYTIEPDDFSEEDIYLSVELVPDVPTDRMQRANTASMMVQWGYPREMALEDLGVDDPQEAMTTWMREKIVIDKMQARLQAEAQMIMNQVAMQQQQMQMQMQNEMAAQQQQQMGPGPEEMMAMQRQQAMAQEEAMMQEGPFPGGQGFNTAMGGTPMAQAFPGATRELMQGEDISGNPMASLGEM